MSSSVVGRAVSSDSDVSVRVSSSCLHSSIPILPTAHPQRGGRFVRRDSRLGPESDPIWALSDHPRFLCDDSGVGEGKTGILHRAPLDERGGLEAGTGILHRAPLDERGGLEAGTTMG